MFFAAALPCMPAEPPSQIGMTLEIVRVSESAALRLIPVFAEEASAIEALDEIREMIATDDAQCVEVLRGLAVERAICSVSAGEQVRYGMDLRPDDPSVGPRPSAIKKRAQGEPTGYPAVDYQRYDCGAFLQFRSQAVPESDWIFSNLYVSRQQDMGPVKYEIGVRASGLKLYFPKPEIHKITLEVTLFLKSNVPALINTAKVRNGGRAIELHILTATKKAMPGFPKMTAKARRQPDSLRLPHGDLKLSSVMHNVRIETLRFYASQTKAIEGRSMLMNAADCEKGLQHLFGAVGSGEAELVEYSTSTIATGHGAARENVREMTYATTPEPRGTPNGSGGLFSSPGPILFTGGPGVGRLHLPMVPPFTFESRHVGFADVIKVEVDPKAQITSVVGRVERVELGGYVRWAAGRDWLGTTGYIYQPDFRRLETATTLNLHSGKLHLHSCNKRNEPEGRFELVLLRATILPITTNSKTKQSEP